MYPHLSFGCLLPPTLLLWSLVFHELIAYFSMIKLKRLCNYVSLRRVFWMASPLKAIWWPSLGCNINPIFTVQSHYRNAVSMSSCYSVYPIEKMWNLLTTYRLRTTSQLHYNLSNTNVHRCCWSLSIIIHLCEKVLNCLLKFIV